MWLTDAAAAAGPCWSILDTPVLDVIVDGPGTTHTEHTVDASEMGSDRSERVRS